MSEPIVITRDKVHRGWSDLEPKIAIAGVAGFAAIIALIVAKQFNITLPSEVASVIPASFALLCGYLTPSSGTVVTRRTDGATTTESHSAPTVTTVSTPIQAPAPAAPIVPVQAASTIPATSTGTTDQPGFTQVLTSPDEQATEVVNPPYSRGASILSQLGQNR